MHVQNLFSIKSHAFIQFFPCPCFCRVPRCVCVCTFVNVYVHTFTHVCVWEREHTSRTEFLFFVSCPPINFWSSSVNNNPLSLSLFPHLLAATAAIRLAAIHSFHPLISHDFRRREHKWTVEHIMKQQQQKHKLFWKSAIHSLISLPGTLTAPLRTPANLCTIKEWTNGKI